MSSHDTHSSNPKGKKHKKTQRRPGRDNAGMSGGSEHVESEMTQETLGEVHHESDHSSNGHQEESNHKKVHIEFYGSELLKQKAPQAFDFAETVAEEWVNDGRFDSIPVESPLAKAFTVYGLRKAKKIEKKLEQSGVIAIVKSGIDYAQSKLRK